MKRLIAVSAVTFLAFSQAANAQGDGLDDLPGMDEGAKTDEAAATDTAAVGAEAGASMGDSDMVGSVSGARMNNPKSQLLVEAFLEFNLSKGNAFKPVSLQPDVWYGIDPKITAGLVTTSRALSGFLVGGFPGGGLCLGSTTGDDISCRSRLAPIGVVGRYHLLDSPVVLSADGGLIVNDFDKFALALKLGATGQWQQSDKLVVLFNPNIAIGLSARTIDGGAAGDIDNNKEVLNLPVAAMYRVMPKLTAGVQTGFRTPFSNAGDTFSIPLSLGARYIVTEKITIDGSFTLPLLLTGQEDASGFAARVLSIGAAYIL